MTDCLDDSVLSVTTTSLLARTNSGTTNRRPMPIGSRRDWPRSCWPATQENGARRQFSISSHTYACRRPRSPIADRLAARSMPVGDAPEGEADAVCTELMPSGPVRSDDVQRVARDQQVPAVRRPGDKLAELG